MPTTDLSPREREVVDLLVQGYTAAGAAARLGISPKTASTFIARAKERLGLETTNALIVWAVVQRDLDGVQLLRRALVVLTPKDHLGADIETYLKRRAGQAPAEERHACSDCPRDADGRCEGCRQLEWCDDNCPKCLGRQRGDR